MNAFRHTLRYTEGHIEPSAAILSAIQDEARIQFPHAAFTVLFYDLPTQLDKRRMDGRTASRRSPSGVNITPA